MCRPVARGSFLSAVLVSIPVVLIQGTWRVVVILAPWALAGTVITTRALLADVRALTHLTRIAIPAARTWYAARTAVPAPPPVNRGLAITAEPHHLLWSDVLAKESSR
ncbi:hypothetical protein [Micromonospora sp. NPDC004704]